MVMSKLRLRCGVVAVAASAGAAAVVAVTLPIVLDVGTRIGSDGGFDGTGHVGFPELLVAGCAGLALLGTAGCWLGVLTVTAEAWRAGAGPAAATRPPGCRAVPAGLRRAVLTACGVAVLGAVPAGAATPGAAPDGAAGPAGATPVLHGLPYPDRAEDRPLETASASPGPVTVRRGDTLWALARDRLSHGGAAATTDADVVLAVERWHHVNHRVIGPDPDLILPGQRLRPPGASTGPASTHPS